MSAGIPGSPTVRAVAMLQLPPQPTRGATVLPAWSAPALKTGHAPWPENRRRFAVQITDSEGHVGVYGPCPAAVVEIIRDQIAPGLIGLPTGRWRQSCDRLLGRHRRGAHYQFAIGVVDLALWDLRGVQAGRPAWALLGGPAQPRVPAYATAMGLDVDHPLSKDIARWLAEAGFWGQKWTLPGAERGEPASTDAQRLARLREAVGTDARLMVDGLGRWDAPRLRSLAPVLIDLGVEWLEEPMIHTPPTAVPSGVVIAGGEHAYDRAEQLRLLTSGAVQIWQPDVVWHGGLTPSLAMVDLASELGIPSFPHAGSLPAALHLAALSKAVRAVEYHLTLDPLRHAVLRTTPAPVDGAFTAPESPGVAGPYEHLDHDVRTHLAGDNP